MGGGRVVYEVGYGGRAPGELLAAVERLGAALFDVRLSPRSRQPAWNRGRLEAVFGARYAHVPELGNANYKDPAGGIELADPEAGLARVRAAVRPVVLMCACRDYRGCHRRTVAELLEPEGWRVEPLDLGAASAEGDAQLSLPFATPEPVSGGTAGGVS